MKLMLNGAVTLGTMDGANVEIFDSIGNDNIFIFSLTTSEVEELNKREYKSLEYYNNSQRVKETLDFIRLLTIDGVNFNFITDMLLTNDTYMCLADFASYVERQADFAKAFEDRELWGGMSLVNIANAGVFSADRLV